MLLTLRLLHQVVQGRMHGRHARVVGTSTPIRPSASIDVFSERNMGNLMEFVFPMSSLHLPMEVHSLQHAWTGRMA